MTIIEDKQISREASPRFGSQPLKIPKEQFQMILRLIAQQPDFPPALANAFRAVAFLVEVQTLRELEEAFLLDGSYEKLREDHRSHLAELIAEGEEIVWNSKRNGLAADQLKFTHEDVQATLDSLHTTFRCEHGPKNSQKTNELIGKLFDGSES